MILKLMVPIDSKYVEQRSHDVGLNENQATILRRLDSVELIVDVSETAGQVYVIAVNGHAVIQEGEVWTLSSQSQILKHTNSA